MQLHTVCEQTLPVLGLNGLRGMLTTDTCLYSKMKHDQKLPWESGMPAVGQPIFVPVHHLAGRWRWLWAHCLLARATLLPSLPDGAWKQLWGVLTQSQWDPGRLG